MALVAHKTLFPLANEINHQLVVVVILLVVVAIRVRLFIWPAIELPGTALIHGHIFIPFTVITVLLINTFFQRLRDSQASRRSSVEGSATRQHSHVVGIVDGEHTRWCQVHHAQP